MDINHSLCSFGNKQLRMNLYFSFNVQPEIQILNVTLAWRTMYIIRVQLKINKIIGAVKNVSSTFSI